MKHKSLKGVFSVRKTTDQFLSEVRLVHGDQFDYSLVEYTGWDKKIKIICDAHGVFEQRAGKHLKGQGCSKCVKDKRKHTFIKRYGVDNPMKLKVFQEKSKETVRKKYGVDYINQSDTINTWCDRDVKKRQLAKENNLNYVVLWKKQDIDDWFSLGCPSGRDWKREYTWKEG